MLRNQRHPTGKARPVRVLNEVLSLNAQELMVKHGETDNGVPQ